MLVLCAAAASVQALLTHLLSASLIARVPHSHPPLTGWLHVDGVKTKPDHLAHGAADAEDVSANPKAERSIRIDVPAVVAGSLGALLSPSPASLISASIRQWAVERGPGSSPGDELRCPRWIVRRESRLLDSDPAPEQAAAASPALKETFYGRCRRQT